MKIIASVSHGVFLAEVTTNELEQVTLGTVARRYFVVGARVDVNSAYRRALAWLGSRNRLDSAISQLRGLAEALEPLGSVLTLPPDDNYADKPAIDDDSSRTDGRES